jgi:muramoyltetrapeptide carboxypeptidase
MLAVEMAGQIDPFTEELFWRCITSNKKLGMIPLPKEPLPQALHHGKAHGRLLGGNLSLIVGLLGTKCQPDFTDSLLFIEEVTEEPYRVDRMLTHLRNASVYTKSSGILFGQFTDCIPLDTTKPSLTTDEILAHEALLFGKPVLANLPFGHVPQKMTLPFGARATMDADAGSLHILEAAVC